MTSNSAHAAHSSSVAAVLVRHGATEWSMNGRHTSTTDLPLLAEGEADAKALGERLAGRTFGGVLTSPMQRARRTAELAGYDDAEVTPDLHEWAYGDYEGLTTPEIRERVPGWTVWSSPSPGGESAADVTLRCDRVIERIASARPQAPLLVVAHGHILRALAARWLGLPAGEGRLFRLDTATISELGREREQPVLLSWNA